MGKLQHKISLYTLVCTFLQMGASSWTDDMYLQSPRKLGHSCQYEDNYIFPHK